MLEQEALGHRWTVTGQDEAGRSGETGLWSFEYKVSESRGEQETYGEAGSVRS